MLGLMVTRVESAAATRRALLHAAGDLLNTGGPDAVTLREVGSRSGVSRSAPYRHFTDKEHLLTVVATEAWQDLGDTLDVLLADTGTAPDQAVRRALLALIGIGRSRPHLYRLMFTTPSGDPTEAADAVARSQDLFLELVARVVGVTQARRYGALLFTSAHGATDMELSGHLVGDKWQATAEDLVELQIAMLPPARERGGEG